MTQVRKRTPANPKQAAACCRPVDNLLDPEWFKALGDPTRVRIMGCLVKCSRPCAVGEIAECCSVDLSVVSRHLQILERAGLLESTKQGRSVSYAVRFADICSTLRSLADAIEQCCPTDAAKAAKKDAVARSDAKLKVLFLCTGNSCRSQMAEGWARALKRSVIDAYSAGTDPHEVNPLAVRAMAEVGIDISRHTSKRPQDLSVTFDVVITVCDSAHEACPNFPGARIVHAGFDDPPRLARSAPTTDDAMRHYRRVRDEIRAFIETLPDSLDNKETIMTPPTTANTIKDSACCSPGCCSGTKTKAPVAIADPAADDALREQVRAGYAKIAQSGSWSAAQTAAVPVTGCCAPTASSGGGGCCGAVALSPDQLASAIGYSQGELAATPEGANMGLSCGNPTAIASLKPGEVVLDLGAGGGFDCFIAGPKVGPTGKVIGVDMTPDMLTKARRNLAAYEKHTGYANVEFRLGEIENLPVADASIDVVISNCVLNLSPDKPQVWREIARVLKPGGRVAVSDLALLHPLPESVRQDVEALVGCIAGAVLVEETRAQAAAAGLTDIVLTPKPQYIEAMTNWQDPLYQKIMAALPANTKPSDLITSLDVTARNAM